MGQKSIRRKLVVGNWKMHGSLVWNKALLEGVIAGLRDLPGADYVVCVPYPYFCQAQAMLQGTNVAWGAQNLCAIEDGALTGAVAPHMLTDFGCTYVIMGHSERRLAFNETDDSAAVRFYAAIKAGMTPIFCMGESEEERESDWTEFVVGRQLDSVLRRYGVETLRNAVLAYEPLWAVGTGNTATPAQAQEVHTFIRNRVAKCDAEVAAGLRILYGGSVKAANAAQLFAMPDVDGGLIGEASLEANEFVGICRAAN